MPKNGADHEHDGDRWLTPAQAAELLAIPKSTLYGLVQRREVPFARFTERNIRFLESQLQEWARGRVIGGAK